MKKCRRKWLVNAWLMWSSSRETQVVTASTIFIPILANKHVLLELELPVVDFAMAGQLGGTPSPTLLFFQS